jgi:hypothetical protein
MEERYIKAIDPDKWIRPAGWPALPNLTSADNKYAGVYAVYEGKTNRLQISHNSASSNNTIDWGDGTSVTWNSTAGQSKLYNYSTIVAPVLVDDAGYNYKPVLIQFQLNSGTPGALQLSNTTAGAGTVVQSNWLDLLMSWPTTFTFAQRPRLMQRLNLLKGPGNINLTTVHTNLTGLKVFEGNMFGPGNTNQYTNIQTAFQSIGPVRMGDMEVNKIGAVIPATGIFSSGFIKSIGNITLNNVSGISDFFNACRDLQTVGNIIATSSTSISTMFNGCTNLERIGTIDIGSSGTVTNLNTFNGCFNLREIEFINNSGARLTTTTGMFTNCIKLRRLRLPGIIITFTVAECDLERQALIDLFNDLGSVSPGTQTITITNNPGVATLTAGEIAIATGKGWIVTTV